MLFQREREQPLPQAQSVSPLANQSTLGLPICRPSSDIPKLGTPNKNDGNNVVLNLLIWAPPQHTTS